MRALALLVGMAVLAGACSSRQQDSTVPPCPQVGIVADARKLVSFREGQGRDLADVQFEAEMAGLSGECVYTRQRDSVSVEVKLQVNAMRGPAARERKGAFTYFVAVLDAEHNVLAREEFSSELEFPANVARIATLEELEQRIPLKEGKDGSAFEVLVGFKLSRDQLEYNRARTR